MASSVVVLKSLGGLSIAAAGATGTYFLFRRSEISDSENLQNIDNLVLNSSNGWTFNSNNPTIITETKEDIKITGKFTRTISSQTKTWVCKVKGLINDPELNKTLDVQTQLTKLKTEIGIVDQKTQINQAHFKSSLKTVKDIKKQVPQMKIQQAQ